MMIGRLAAALVVAGVVLLALSLLAGSAPADEAATAPVVPTVSPVDQGRTLFRAKSCTTCHGPGLHGAPNLRHYDPDPTFLRQWLRDPEAVRPGTAMPNLQLDEAEIEALIAYVVEYARPGQSE